MYLSKKTKKKRLPRKTVMFLGAIAIASIVLLTGLIVILTKGRELKDTLVQMPFGADSEYFTVGETIVYSDAELLTCVDASQKLVWKLKLFTSGLSFTANDDLIAATGQGVVQVLNAKGNHLFSTQLNGEIKSARVGKDMIAAFVLQQADNETPAYIVVFNLTGEALFRLDVTNRYVLDYGFDEKSDALYVLELDVSGGVPVSRISTYRPDTQAITFIKEFKDQLVSSLYWIGDSIYAIGTNQLTMYESINSSNKQVMVYGWVLEDVCCSSEPKFIYVPLNNTGTYDIARVIRSAGSEITINLPPGVFKILHQGEKIYCFANNQIFVYTGEGKYLRTYDLPYAIDGVERAIKNHVYIKSGKSVTLMPLP